MKPHPSDSAAGHQASNPSPRRFQFAFCRQPLLLGLCIIGMAGCSEPPSTEQAVEPTSPPATQQSPSPTAAARPFVGAKPTSETTPAAQTSPSLAPEASETPEPEVSPAVSGEPQAVLSPDANALGESAEQGLAFTDVSDLQTAKYVTELQALDVFGLQTTEFRPYDTLTRAEYITWLYQANNTIRREKYHLRLEPTFDPGFSDIDDTHPAYKYVQAFANAGYAVGYEDKTFKPDQPITREEMIAIKVGLDTEKNHKPTKLGLNYADAEQIDPRYTGFIRIDHTQNNIERAFGNVKTLKPKQAVKRHEAAATLWKIRFDTAERTLKRQQKANP